MLALGLTGQARAPSCRRPVKLDRSCKKGCSEHCRPTASVLVRASTSNGLQEQHTVVLKTSDRVVVPVTRQHDAGQTLQAYMRLPVSQYVLIEVPAGGTLKRVTADLFDVIVPPVRFFDLWVQPRVRCRVRLLDQPERVDIRCVECLLFSSPAVEQLRLNDRVRFNVHTCFTRQQEPPAIVSESWIDVAVEPPFPFSLLPDGVLQTVGNAALHASLFTLQRVFIRSLARDYAKWAIDAAYRQQRVVYAARSDELIRQGLTANAAMQ